jgi:hypothetical protein
VVARQALVALAIVVGGAVAAFAVYTFGWHDTADRGSASPTQRTDPFVKTVTDVTGTHRIYTLRYGDIVVRPGAAARCAAYQEGGFPNLHCTRIGNGRHTFVFYENSVQVYGPNAEPMTPSDSFRWLPKSIRFCAVSSPQGYGLLVKNISCRVGQQLALACSRFTSRRSEICSAVGDRWRCTATSQDTGPVQRCVAGRKWMSIRLFD